MADEQRAVRRSTGKGTTFEEREDREFLLFFFSLSTLQERDFLKRGGSCDDSSLSFSRVGMDPNASTSSLFFLFFLLNAFIDEREEAHRYHHPNAFSYAKTSSQHFFVHDE